MVQLKFSKKAEEQIKARQEAGGRAASKKTREARDFEADYKGAFHVSSDGWYGHPAAAFRNAMIDACRIVGFVMTRGKLAVFVEADGYEADSGTPLVRVNGEPRMTVMPVRNETGVIDLRARPMFDEWDMDITVKYDADMFGLEDVTNLLWRSGEQCGIGEGRHNSKKSFGMGWGSFRIDLDEEDGD